MIVRIEDLRRAGVCRDARHWFARHGLDWRDFVRNGIDADALLATGDSQDAVGRVIAAAKERTNG